MTGNCFNPTEKNTLIWAMVYYPDHSLQLYPLLEGVNRPQVKPLQNTVSVYLSLKLFGAVGYCLNLNFPGPFQLFFWADLSFLFHQSPATSAVDSASTASNALERSETKTSVDLSEGNI